MQRLEQSDLEDLAVFVAGVLCGFYFAVLAIEVAMLFRSNVILIDFSLIDLTVQNIIRIPRSSRTIAKVIYRILNRKR